MFKIDPIVECQLNEGTVFLAPLQGEMVKWEIIRRDIAGILARAEGGIAHKSYTFSQFWYLYSIKRSVRFVSVEMPPFREV